MRFLLILPLLLIASPSQADPCAELPKPSVTIKRIDERISYNTEYSYKSLTNIGASLARPGKQVLGLTRGNATVSFASNTPAIIATRCATPASPRSSPSATSTGRRRARSPRPR